MNMLQTILVTAGIIIWVCISITFLVNSIQSIINDRKREKRELESQKRDIEYHELRMKSTSN